MSNYDSDGFGLFEVEDPKMGALLAQMQMSHREQPQHSSSSTGQSPTAVPSRSDPVFQLPSFQLSWKGTFINVSSEEQQTAELSPRALSDPGSISSSYSSHFAAEQAYVSSLSQQVNSTRVTRLKQRSSRAESSTNSAVFSDSGEYSSDALQRIQSCEDVFSKAVPPESCIPCEPEPSRSSQQANVTSNSVSDANIKSQARSRMRMNRDELKVHMRRKAAEIPNQRLCNALTSIQEIPEQVGEVFQQSATILVDEVTSKVSKARHILAGKVEDPQASTDVATQVQEIPDMVMASFEVSFAKAMNHVRGRVDDVIQVLECNYMENEEVVQQLWTIPEEVRQIARDAVKEASVASQDKVVEKLEHVMQNISEEKKTVALIRAKQSIVDALPQTLPDTVKRSAEVAHSNVRHATEVVVEQGMGDCGYVANRVVADTLLRLKVGDERGVKDTGLGQLEEPEPELQALCNPGSFGHPELCSRACLYFSQGKCTNGMSCAFCHAPHSKRAIHLDKRHREMLRSLSFMDRLSLILPLLKQKLESVSGCSHDLLLSVEALDEVRTPSEDGPAYRKKQKLTRTLLVALRFMSARSLLALLHHTPREEDCPQQEAIQRMMKHIRPLLTEMQDGQLDSEMKSITSASLTGPLAEYERPDDKMPPLPTKFGRAKRGIGS